MSFFLKFHRWTKKRRQKYRTEHASWRQFSKNPERPAIVSLILLRLAQVIKCVFFPFSFSYLDILVLIVAPQDDKRFWTGLPVKISPLWFGQFKDYEKVLQDNTETSFSDEKDLMAWVSRCRYISDLKQFDKADYWQMPYEFEKRQSGDCEDFALYLWHHLCKMGVNARFVIGTGRRPYRVNGHAWVTIQRAEGYEVVDGSLTGRDFIRVPEEKARINYLPMFSIDSQCKVYWHG